MNRNIDIHVQEHIHIDQHGVATCSRIYSFFNPLQSPIKIDPTLKISLPKDVQLSNVFFEEGPELIWTHSRGAYQLDIEIIVQDITIASLAKLRLRVEYRWPDFVPKSSEPSYVREMCINHKFRFRYELEIHAVDVGLLAQPAFSVQPTELRSEGRHVTRSLNNDGYVIRTACVPPGQTLSIAIAGGHGGVKLPVLEALANEYQSQAPFQDYSIVFIQHLLDDFEAFIETFIRAGLRPENAYVVGIPYSTKKLTAGRLRATYATVETPQSYPFADELRNVLSSVYARCRRQNKKFLVVEDGGYVASLFRDSDPHVSPPWASHCIGIVEQTRNGIRVSKEWQNDPARYRNSFNFSVINVAETHFKLEEEASLIGTAVVFNMQRLLACYEEQDLNGNRALLIGCGSIGSQIGAALIRQGCKLSVVDKKLPEEIKKFPEKATYYPVEELDSVISQHNLIIGSTGNGIGYPEPDMRPPFDRESSFLNLQHKAVLINASSKLCEYNWEVLRNIAPRCRTKRGFGREYDLPDGRIIRVAADGYPVNFYNSESAPASKMQPILGMLFVAACRLALTVPEARQAGIIEFSHADEQHIVSLFNAQRSL